MIVDPAGKVRQWRLDQLPLRDPVLLGDLKSGLEAAFFSKDGNHMLIPRRLTIEGNRLIDLFAQASYEDKPVSKVSLNPSPSGKVPAAALSSGGSL